MSRIRSVKSLAIVTAVIVGAAVVFASPGVAQPPSDGEVRQIVSFTLQPGTASDVRAIYRDELLELYRADPAMRSLRIFRESESPVPVDLVVVRGFDGMAGMDASNEVLAGLAARAGISVGAIYGRISDLATGHTDEFVRMLPELGQGDPASMPITAFLRYRLTPGTLPRFERLLSEVVVPAERRGGWPSSTGVYLIGDGWDVLRTVGFASLGDYEAWLRRARPSATEMAFDQVVERWSAQLLVAIPEFTVR